MSDARVESRSNWPGSVLCWSVSSASFPESGQEVDQARERGGDPSFQGDLIVLLGLLGLVEPFHQLAPEEAGQGHLGGVVEDLLQELGALPPAWGRDDWRTTGRRSLSPRARPESDNAPDEVFGTTRVRLVVSVVPGAKLFDGRADQGLIAAVDRQGEQVEHRLEVSGQEARIFEEGVSGRVEVALRLLDLTEGAPRPGDDRGGRAS